MNYLKNKLENAKEMLLRRAVLGSKSDRRKSVGRENEPNDNISALGLASDSDRSLMPHS